MADPADYYARWKLNIEHATSVSSAMPTAKDWEIVFRFYAMLHLVEGYQRTKHDRFWSNDHAERRRNLKGSPEIKDARDAYFDLQDLSEDVRYNPTYTPPHGAFEDAKKWVSKVESVVGPKLQRKLTPAHASGAPPSGAPPSGAPPSGSTPSR